MIVLLFVGEQLSLDDIAGLRRHEKKRPYKIDIRHVGDFDGDGGISLSDVDYLLSNDSNAAEHLTGDGDFRSGECVELLKQADIVVTNPPFSPFREYVGQLMEHGKQFIILADQNAITYKETFNYIKDNRLWLGYENGGIKWFRVPMHYDIKTESRKKIENGVKYFSMGRIVWFTNLDTTKRHEELILVRKYTPEAYPKYDNYDAINVDRVDHIPADYYEPMGVPITFVDKYNPDQFVVIGMDRPLMTELTGKVSRFWLNGKEMYARIIVQRKR